MEGFMEELKEMYLDVRFTDRTDKNREILDKIEEHLYGILKDIKNNPSSLTEGRLRLDIKEVVKMYYQYLCISFPKV